MKPLIYIGINQEDPYKLNSVNFGDMCRVRCIADSYVYFLPIRERIILITDFVDPDTYLNMCSFQRSIVKDYFP